MLQEWFCHVGESLRVVLQLKGFAFGPRPFVPRPATTSQPVLPWLHAWCSAFPFPVPDGGTPSHMDFPSALKTFKIAFDVPMIKEWHWMLHLPDHLARYGLLPNCFAQERMHKPIGQQANLLTNQKYERHLLDQAKEISHLDAPGLFPESVFLLKPKPASKKVLANLNLLLEPKSMQLCNVMQQRLEAPLSALAMQSFTMLATMCSNTGKWVRFKTILILVAIAALWSKHGTSSPTCHPSSTASAPGVTPWASYPLKPSLLLWYTPKASRIQKSCYHIPSTAKTCRFCSGNGEKHLVVQAFFGILSKPSLCDQSVYFFF